MLEDAWKVVQAVMIIRKVILVEKLEAMACLVIGRSGRLPVENRGAP